MTTLDHQLEHTASAQCADDDRQNSDGVDLDAQRWHDDGGAGDNWPPAEPRDDTYFRVSPNPTEPSRDDGAHGRAPASPAQGSRGEGSSQVDKSRSGKVDSRSSDAASADDDTTHASAVAGACVCGRPNGLPSAGASDIAPARRYPRCGGDLTSTVAAQGVGVTASDVERIRAALGVSR